ncbi:GPI ethanolamine phosphate transferase 1-like isoform X1 [Ruditapes philippinarum]|uniref:GPI ethanolamine phosphate transferase 1-like isoform X1 n=1 Tax=Ruditapes philippinarum TaxID=129788 RepID=UPI00295AADBE|nr:GPI ethanolamine phosphate transferase 1-like isoform X1 [Ruditapes philippinarum]
MSTWMIITAGFLVQGIVFISIFDIYFTTHLIGGQQQHASSRPPPAKRLIFIVADGLRADKTLMLQPDGTTPAPYLRNIAEKEGTWGVSTAGIPTATRPGHVAMTAGFYEDPTSVAKDIGGGAINFDTIFQETTYTWTWDTPKFLEKVSTDHPDRIFSEQYPGQRKYLSGINPKDMDSWVFDEVTNFLNGAKTDASLKEKMNKDKVLFFLHLGGIDHAGYIVRPNSKEYLTHVSFLDEGVKDIVGKFEDFFGHDGKTAYVFTSDHGMTNWGAHGDGMPDEIHCPLLVWGAGIRKAQPEDNLNRYDDTLSQEWSLTRWKRANLEQPSLAPLMAATIGITFPRNAVYPFPGGFFDVPAEDEFGILYANLKQLLENYQAIEKYTHKGPFAFTFRSYRPLAPSMIKSLHTDIQSLKESGNFASAIAVTKQKIDLAVKGIRHYKLYSKNPLWLATFSSMIGWFCFCALVLIQQHENWEDIRVTTPVMTNTKHIIIQCAVAIAVFDLIFLYAQSTPLTQCIHFLLPIPIWTAAAIKWYEIGNIFPIIKRQKHLLPVASLCVIGIISIVAAMHYRFILGLAIAIFSIISIYGNKSDIDKTLRNQWLFSSIGLAALVAKPLGDRELHYNLVIFSAVLSTIACALYHYHLEFSAVTGRLFRQFGKRYAIFQILKIALATGILTYSSYLTENNIRTPLSVQIPSWIIFFISLCEPFFVNTDIQSRLTSMAFGYVAPFILLSIGQETLCYICLVWNHYLYVEVERNLTKSQPIFLPRTSNDSTNRVPNKTTTNGKSAANGHVNVKHHKHTKSNDYLMFQPAVTEWQNLDFTKGNENETRCKREITTGDLRRVMCYLLCMFAGLYGAGNIMSINSFDVQDVFCFITVSNPPRMGPLMIFKLMMPGMVAACFLRAINVITFTSIRNFSLVVFMMCGFMNILLFCLVTNTGTWTVIGQSVSHFLIGGGISMFMCLSFGTVHLLTTIKIL